LVGRDELFDALQAEKLPAVVDEPDAVLGLIPSLPEGHR
jgi:hypothetical protein